MAARRSDAEILEELDAAGTLETVAALLEDWRQSMPHSTDVQARLLEATRRARERIHKRRMEELIRARAVAQRIWQPVKSAPEDDH